MVGRWVRKKWKTSSKYFENVLIKLLENINVWPFLIWNASSLLNWKLWEKRWKHDRLKYKKTILQKENSNSSLLTKFGVSLRWSAAEKYNCRMRQKHLSRPAAYKLICHRVKKSATIHRKKIMLVCAGHSYLRQLTAEWIQQHAMAESWFNPAAGYLLCSIQ